MVLLLFLERLLHLPTAEKLPIAQLGAAAPAVLIVPRAARPLPGEESGSSHSGPFFRLERCRTTSPASVLALASFPAGLLVLVEMLR